MEAEAIDNSFVNPRTNRVNPNLKRPKEISNENNFTKANTEAIEKSNENEEIDIEKEKKIPQEFNRLNEGAGDRPKKENTESRTIYSAHSQSELDPYNKIFEDKVMSQSDFAKNIVQVDKEIRQEKRLRNLLSTETNEKNETTVKSNNNKQDQEKEKNHSTKKKDIFKIRRLKNKRSKRKFQFNIAKNKIFNICGKNIANMIKRLFDLSNVEYPNDINNNFVLLTTNDKIGFSDKKNIRFIKRTIKYLISKSSSKNSSVDFVKRRNAFLENILKRERNKKKVKAINKAFNLKFRDFLMAFMNDKQTIRFKKNNNNKTEVEYSEKPSIEFSSDVCTQVNFGTFKNHFSDNEGYEEKHREEFKREMSKLIAQTL